MIGNQISVELTHAYGVNSTGSHLFLEILLIHLLCFLHSQMLRKTHKSLLVGMTYASLRKGMKTIFMCYLDHQHLFPAGILYIKLNILRITIVQPLYF